MLQHKRRMVRAIYIASTQPGSAMECDYSAWMKDVERRRGQLDRKKRVSQHQLLEALGDVGADIELERFVFAVERYLLQHALRVIERSLDIPLAQVEHVPSVVREALAIRVHVNGVLRAHCARELGIDEVKINSLLRRASKSSLEDAFQTDFAELIPRQVRHAIGSYYTPLWLARHVLRGTGFKHEQPQSLMRDVCDPACGSGVFLVAAAEEIRQAVSRGDITAMDGTALVVDKLHGIDIEMVPCLLTIASLTLAARTIAAYGDLPLLRLPSKILNEDSLDARDGLERVQVIVSNPPWVNWEYLPTPYRRKHAPLWEHLNIFDARGKTMSFSKEDISALFFAHAVRYRLTPDGAFGFVVPESLFKSTLNHRGFRRFELGAERAPYRVSILEDFVKVRPFEGVANRTVVAYGEAGVRVQYPVEYLKRAALRRGQQPTTGSGTLTGAVEQGVAQLAEASDRVSSWSTGSTAAMETHRMLDGTSAYRARTGLFTGGANAVFHVRPRAKEDHGLVHFNNVVERAKRVVPQVEAVAEAAFVYPFLRGRDVQQWRSSVELGVLLPHTRETKMMPVQESTLREVAPQLLKYFQGFREVLDDRKGFAQWEQQFRDIGFYACQRVGDYTFADWKVVWRYISSSFTTAVVGPHSFAGMEAKPVIPNEKLMLVACESETEAYFVGGILASSIVVDHVKSRMVSTQVSPSIIAGMALPKFDMDDPLHLRIAQLCHEGHRQVAMSGQPSSSTVAKLDELAGSLWGVTVSATEGARARNPF